MASTLRPVSAVVCPSTGLLVAVEECKDCGAVLDVRDPWRHYAVRCKIGGKSEGIYL